MKIVCIDGEHQYFETVQRDVIEPLASAGIRFDWFEERFADTEAAIARAAGYDALYVIGDQGPVPAGLLRQNPQLRLVSFVGTGAARFVDFEEAREAGVTVTNVPDFASESVAELAIALTFAVARRLTEADRIVRAGEWTKNQGLKLAGGRFGVVGAGAIGGRTLARAKGLGMEPVLWNRSDPEGRAAELGARSVSLEELFATSLVVSLHLTHSAETDGFITRELLESMRPDAILINTARAEIVDNAALRELLAAGTIFGAGIDNFEHEPALPEEIPHPETNVALSPHIGFHTNEADDVFRLAGENILAFRAGTPTNVVC